MDILNILKTRRSIRVYQEKEVPKELLFQILEAARWAPSGGNIQPWHFIILTDPYTRKEVGNYTRFLFIKSSHVEKAPVVVLLCFDRRKGKYGRYDVTLAGGNIMIMAHSLGLGSCWIGAFDEKKLKEILNIPEHIEIVGLITLGYPDERVSAPPRIDLEKIIHWESWDNVKRKSLGDNLIKSGPFSLVKRFVRFLRY